MPNTRIRELCGVSKGWMKELKSVLQWFGNAERMGNDRVDKKVYGKSFSRSTAEEVNCFREWLLDKKV